jgi:hypothetical protein
MEPLGMRNAKEICDQTWSPLASRPRGVDWLVMLCLKLPPVVGQFTFRSVHPSNAVLGLCCLKGARATVGWEGLGGIPCFQTQEDAFMYSNVHIWVNHPSFQAQQRFLLCVITCRVGTGEKMNLVFACTVTAGAVAMIPEVPVLHVWKPRAGS